MSATQELTDHDTAEAIRDGQLPSPTKYGTFWLFDLRITGTGAAYRDSIDEWALRDPKEWTSPEFVERCNGLPVIFEHPERSGLDSKEWERAIGTIVLPYVKGDEVWGIAKIYDEDAALLMQTTHRSTSPGVTPPRESVPKELDDGTVVLSEGLPLVLDHLAVCSAGVWDKDGPPSGIRLDERKETSVPDQSTEDLMKQLDDARRRADSAEKERDDALKAKKDAEEMADKARKDAEEKAEKEKAERMDRMACDRMDGESDEMWDARKKDARKDASEEEKKELESRDKEREDKRRKDAAAKETPDADKGMLFDAKLKALEEKNAELLRRLDSLSAQPTIEDRNAIAIAFHRADSLYQMLGDHTPPTMPGESPLAYRRRLAAGLRKYSERWKDYSFHDAVDAQAFGLIEDAIYADASAYAKSPASDAPFQLRAVEDRNTLPGKVITRFYGDARAAWLPFQPPMAHKLVRINTAPDRR